MQNKITTLSPTGCNGRCSCPYKSWNEEWNIDPINTALWNLCNQVLLCNNCSLKPALRYYEQTIKFTKIAQDKLPSVDIVKTGFANLYKWIQAKREDPTLHLYQESKIEIPRNIDRSIWISCQPDIIGLYDEPDEEGVLVDIRDAKSWSKYRYEDPKIWTENLQWIFYARTAIEYFATYFTEANRKREVWNEVKVRFTFVVIDKKTGEIYEFPRVMTENEIISMMTLKLKQMRSNKYQGAEFGIFPEEVIDPAKYPAIANRSCGFCSLAGDCPLTNQESKSKSKADISAENDLFT